MQTDSAAVVPTAVSDERFALQTKEIMQLTAKLVFVFVVFMTTCLYFGVSSSTMPPTTTTTADYNELTANFNEMDQCQAICIDIFFLLPDNPLAMSACQRGCRIFNLIYLRDDRGLNTSKDECYVSCSDAYNTNGELNTACHKGCQNMLKKKQSELETVIVYIEQDAKNIDSQQPEIDELEMSWFLENFVPRDFRNDGDVNKKEYKIPESMYRTLPISELMDGLERPVQARQPAGDWLDCASRNSGIPKSVLVMAILFAILVALYLSITSERKVIGDDMLLGDEEDDDIGAEEEPQAGELPPKVPVTDEKLKCEHAGVLPCGVGQFHVQSGDVLFSAPPKYTLESEKV